PLSTPTADRSGPNPTAPAGEVRSVSVFLSRIERVFLCSRKPAGFLPRGYAPLDTPQGTGSIADSSEENAAVWWPMTARSAAEAGRTYMWLDTGAREVQGE